MGARKTGFVDDQTFHNAVEAYCSRLSYRPGETVGICVSTTADSFDVQVERWGATREVVWSAFSQPGSYVAPPDDADAQGCGWPVTVEIPLEPEWRSGFYLVTLMAAGDRSHAGFVIRGAPAVEDQQSILYVLPTNTWNAYNTWGGKSLYTGGTQVSFGRPFARGMLDRPSAATQSGDERDDRKARPTRFGEVPDADGEIFQRYRETHNYPSAIGSTGWYTHGRRFVEFAEADGYHFDYAVSSDLEEPTALDGYDSVLLVGHDEYWSAPMRSTIEAHVARGGHLASFSGNTLFWKVRLEATPNGQAMVCHKYRGHLDDDHAEGPTGLWAEPSIDDPEWRLLGAGSAFGLYHRFGQATPQGVGGFVVYRPDHWLLDKTGLLYGDVLGRDEGVVGYETVGCPLTLDDLGLPVPSQAAFDHGVPENAEIVAWVPSSNLGVGDYPKSIAALSDQGDLEFIAERIFGGGEHAKTKARHGNAVMITCRPNGDDGGEVITVGTTDWVFGLGSDAAVAQVTRNVLDRIGRGSR